MTTQPSRTGFTLIELMIAIALGSLLVYTAMAGFRVASQTVTITNRMCLENSLIRAGMFEAHYQLDFWTNLDDPDDPANQRLRKTGLTTRQGTYSHYYDLKYNKFPTTVGLAFAPMKDAFPPNKLIRSPTSPSSGSQVPRFPNALNPQVLTTAQLESMNDWEGDTGFDPTYVWAPHDPRTWYRGSMVEKVTSRDLRFGRYGIFSNVDENPIFSTISGQTYSSTTRHLWYPRQLMGLYRAVGFYGVCEYVPSNMIFNAYCNYNPGWGNNVSYGGIPKIFHKSVKEPRLAFVSDDMAGQPQGLYSLTASRSYVVSNPNGRTNPNIIDRQLADEAYEGYDSDFSIQWNHSQASLDKLLEVTLPMPAMMTSKPDHWPTVRVGVGHYVKSAKFVNIAKIRWENPLTGELAELSFTGVGSTLRGARMQRRPDSGWAKWDNAPGAINDPNLDTP